MNFAPNYHMLDDQWQQSLGIALLLKKGALTRRVITIVSSVTSTLSPLSIYLHLAKI